MNSEEDPRGQALTKMLTAARVYRRRGDLAAAWRALDDALVMAPDSAELWELMGLLNLDEEAWETAESCLRKALELDPKRREAEVGLGTAALELARRESAKQTTLELLEQGPAAPNQKTDWIGNFSLLLPGLRQMRCLEFGRGVLFLVGGPFWFYLASFGVRSSGHKVEITAEFYLGLAAFCTWSVLALWDAQRLEQALRDEDLQRL